MTRITINASLLLFALSGVYAQENVEFVPKNSNNVRLLNKDFNAYRDTPSSNNKLGVIPEVPEPGQAEVEGRGNDGPGFEVYKNAARPYWEERTYEFQYGEPRPVSYNHFNEFENSPSRPEEQGEERERERESFRPALDVFDWPTSRFVDEQRELEVQVPAGVIEQDIEFVEVPRREPCTVTEVLTTTYYIKPRPVVTEYTYTTVLLECPTSRPEPLRIESYQVPCDVCEYPQNCDHCPRPPHPRPRPRPRVTKVPVYTVPVQRIPAQNPHPQPTPVDVSVYRQEPARIEPVYRQEQPVYRQEQPARLEQVHRTPCDVCQLPDNCEHCPRRPHHPQPAAAPVEVSVYRQEPAHLEPAHRAPCDVCQHPDNCDHCPRPYHPVPHREPQAQVYTIPCETCSHPHNCDHCGPRPAPQPFPPPCETCEHPLNCDHCVKTEVFEVKEVQEQEFSPRVREFNAPESAPRLVVVPKRYPQVGPRVIGGEPVDEDAEGDKWESEEQELLW